VKKVGHPVLYETGARENTVLENKLKKVEHISKGKWKNSNLPKLPKLLKPCDSAIG